MHFEAGREFVQQFVNVLKEHRSKETHRNENLLQQGQRIVSRLRRERARARVLEKLRSVEEGEETEPEQRTFCLSGQFMRGDQTKFAINGEDVHVCQKTWVFGDLKLGSRVRATCVNDGNRTRVTKILVSDLS